MGETQTSCTRCGACCVTYTPHFLRHELETEPGGWVPSAMTERINDRAVRMRRAEDDPSRCIALCGTPGVAVHCAIYPQRPSPCRAFAPQAAAGHGDAACGDARRIQGLPPLEGSYDVFPFA